MSTDALLALRQALPRLSAAETRVAETIIETPSLVVELTITELAKACGTSQATVARFCQTVGYTGYREFRVAIATSTSREQAERDRFDVHEADIDPDDSVEAVVAKVAYQEVQAIELTAKSLDLTALDAVVDAVIAAPRIDLVGFGSSGLTAQDLHQKLYRIGMVANCFTDVHFALPSAALLGEGGVAIGFSHSGETIETAHALEVAKSSGATTVCITNFPDSPIAHACDLVLTTQARESRYRSGAMSSRIAQLALVDLLFIRVAQRRFDAVAEPLRVTFDAVQSHRITPEPRRAHRA
ncbi:MurR/RpiR family transcriptional regulator [Plantibacter sp. YIM 135249]|jgi:DNA-binding MurR/RpiR family transcriptional regulator|uniref:MurR/RpiR family transcriptional regulator n=1 Tax=Plantibacter sp. YIM 135249 TaxID=3423918 RepID=UPI003D341182